ncbi:MAG: dTDP-4-dehydrorhamnose 3,5-epimerase [Kofleriaceae bacterium]|nr:dTDP-4-dehydrorhamnose 3,5-epimerase [Kofleriaceae bacterium]MBP9168631.1 dTDP-4-dehydrorhamnose 3,5-epimerase [Kofleriaceae bacterium]MBP9857495.1 dTDP-4-dehydrorhamnose 3,5-epimerase [Kofleriaceae bacterium]
MIDGVRRFELAVHADHRGALTEVCPAGRADELGVAFVQDNLSVTRRGVVRGLHYQRRAPQGKLVTVVAGAIFDVAVDLRRASPSFGRWSAVELGPGAQLWLPPGCAHGLQAISDDDAVVLYKLTAPYAPGDEGAIRWDDPTLAIPWPVAPAVVSARDAAAPRWAEAELP